MARETVDIKVTADEAEALRMWRAMREGPEAFAAEMEGMSRRGRRASKSLGDELTSMMGKWISIQTAISLAQDAFRQFVRVQLEFRERSEETTLSIDEMTRSFAVQANLADTAEVRERVRQQILAVAQRRRVTAEAAFVPAQQLVSSGFAPGEVLEGGALDEFLQLLSATAATRPDIDRRELARALVGFMRANQIPFTAGGIRQVGVPLQALFTGTEIQTAALGQFAPAAATIQQFTGASFREQFAIFSQLLDAIGEEARATTAFRVGAVRLAAPSSETVRGLEMIGLAREQVDFQGETFMQVLQRLEQAFREVPPEIRNEAARLIFGRQGLEFYSNIINQAALRVTRERIALGDDQDFRRAVQITEASRRAVRTGAEVALQRQLFSEAVADAPTMQAELERSLLERGRFVAPGRMVFDLLTSLGMSPDRARAISEEAFDLSFITRPFRDEPTGGGQTREMQVRILNADGQELPTQIEAEEINRGNVGNRLQAVDQLLNQL